MENKKFSKLPAEYTMNWQLQQLLNLPGMQVLSCQEEVGYLGYPFISPTGDGST